jgi:hypothetical protein
MADIDTSKAAAWASHADKARALALQHVQTALGILQQVRTLRDEVSNYLEAMHISFRWVGTRLDLMGGMASSSKGLISRRRLWGYLRSLGCKMR